MNLTPCAHLIEPKPDIYDPGRLMPAECDISRGYPAACQRCPAYSAGLTLQERARAEAWAQTFGAAPDRSVAQPSPTHPRIQYLEGFGHD